MFRIVLTLTLSYDKLTAYPHYRRWMESDKPLAPKSKIRFMHLLKSLDISGFPLKCGYSLVIIENSYVSQMVRTIKYFSELA